MIASALASDDTATTRSRSSSSSSSLPARTHVTKEAHSLSAGEAIMMIIMNIVMNTNGCFIIKLS